MADEKPKPVTPPDATEKKTAKGPHGGGNRYFQAKVGKGAVVHDGRPGHSQKKNIK